MDIFKDKTGKEIKAGMYIKHDEDSKKEKVYESSDGYLGINASNENNAHFDEINRELYPLTEFDLAEWAIVNK